jgi:hypothetical protein
VAGTVLFGGEEASEGRRHAKGREETGGGTHAVDGKWLARSGQIEAVRLERAERFKRLRLIQKHAEVELPPGEFPAPEGGLYRREPPEHGDAIRFAIGQRTQQDSIDDAEDGGAGSDAEGEGENGDRGKGGRLTHRSENRISSLEPELRASLFPTSLS